jgi:hypothetical protein
MKVHEVPQDAENYYEDWGGRKVYALDNQGHMTGAIQNGWAVETFCMGLAWKEVKRKVDLALELVGQGSLSPLGVHIEARMTNVALTAAQTGIPRWKVRGHLKPRNYAKLTIDQKKPYEKAFRLAGSLDDLSIYEHWIEE